MGCSADGVLDVSWSSLPSRPRGEPLRGRLQRVGYAAERRLDEVASAAVLDSAMLQVPRRVPQRSMALISG